MNEPAGVGQESPLKYTIGDSLTVPVRAGVGQESPLKYTPSANHEYRHYAGVGQESPLKYTVTRIVLRCVGLGLAKNHRSSTLRGSRSRPIHTLGLAKNHRSSTLVLGINQIYQRWGWPRITAQ